MFPLALDISEWPVAVIGNNHLALKRVRQLQEAGAKQVTLFANKIEEEIKKQVDVPLEERLPQEEEIKHFRLILMAGLENEKAFPLATLAKKYNVLVNVEDQKEYCDFYYTSFIRRGELVISVSTGGASPTLARRIKEWLEYHFPVIWERRVAALAETRQKWKEKNKSNEEINKMTQDYIDKEKWLA